MTTTISPQTLNPTQVGSLIQWTNYTSTPTFPTANNVISLLPKIVSKSMLNNSSEKSKIGSAQLIPFKNLLAYNTSILFNHLLNIISIIGNTVIDYKEGKEWTKDDKYKVWFSKWADIVDNLFIIQVANSNVLNMPRNPMFHVFGEKRKYNIVYGRKISPQIENFNLVISDPNTMSLDQFLDFAPELISTFANTFLYRVITLRDNNKKERKITIINQKLPSNIRLCYDFLSKNNTLNNVYESFLKCVCFGSKNIQSDIGKKIQDSIIGFRPNKSYLDHVKPHIGQESLLTCDINKFYNSVNLTNIVNNNLFGKLFDTLMYSSIRNYSIEELSNSDNYLPGFYQYRNFMRSTFNKLLTTIMFFHTCNGMLPTGTYSSPVLSNMILLSFDYEMNMFLDKKYKESNIAYTRYVDDICVSSLKEKNSDGSFVIDISLARSIEAILNKYGLYLKYTKTHIFGAKDNKVIANLNLPKNKNDSPSIGTKYKLELKNQFDGREFKDLTDQEIGIINWVKTVNRNQYDFITSGIKNYKKNDYYYYDSYQWPSLSSFFKKKYIVSADFGKATKFGYKLNKPIDIDLAPGDWIKYKNYSSYKAGWKILKIVENNLTVSVDVEFMVQTEKWFTDNGIILRE